MAIEYTYPAMPAILLERIGAFSEGVRAMPMQRFDAVPRYAILLESIWGMLS
ncbi:MAG: hypothetical protein IJ833_10570 [Lachnospiraceae bacterium]|nr:hypothetical protein [Lachnospiraceae bacterium]